MSLSVEAVPLDLEGSAGAGELVAHLAEETLEGRVLRRDQPSAQLVAGVVAAPGMLQKGRSQLGQNPKLIILF